MKYNLMILLSVCCIGAVMTAPSFAADTPEQIAAQKAEAEKKAKAEAERKAREEACANGQEANKLAGEFRAAMNAQKFEDAAAVAKKAQALFGKPGVPDLNWHVRNYTQYDLNRAKADVRAKVLPVLIDNYKFIIAQASGDQKIDFMNAYIGVLKFNLPAAEKEIAQIKADRYKVQDASKKKLLALYVADGDFAKADAIAEAILKEVKAGDNEALEKAYADIIAGFTAQGIFSCEAAKKWYDKSVVAVPATGDAKYKQLDAYANFLEQYALVSMEEVDKIRADRDKITDLSPDLKFSIAFNKIDKNDTDEVYQANLKSALALAQDNPARRIMIYEAVTSNAHNAKAKMQDNKALSAFLKDVVLKDEAVLKGYDRRGNSVGRYLTHYATLNYADYAATEAFVKNFPTEDKGAISNALRELYKIAGRRYYHGTDPVFARKIMDLYLTDLYLALANKNINLANNLRRQVIDWAFACNDIKVVEEQLEALSRAEKPDTAYLTTKNAELAFLKKDYKKVVELLAPYEANYKSGPLPAEIYVRSLIATGEVEKAAEVMEKRFNNFPYWTRRNYYQPRLAELKKRAEKIKAAREAAEKK